MAIDRRQKNGDWAVLDEKGNWYTGSYDGLQLAVLMDLRDELQRLNGLLNCPRFMSIPTTLKTISRKLPARKKRTAK